MSISKIKRDIELLKQRLIEIETEILDPIERNEYKQELQRKIKKLNRSQNSLEQLEREQQELKSLKSEFSLNNNESVDQKKSEPDKPVEHASSTTNNSITVESKIEVSENIEDVWDSQVQNTDSWKKNSDTNLYVEIFPHVASTAKVPSIATQIILSPKSSNQTFNQTLSRDLKNKIPKPLKILISAIMPPLGVFLQTGFSIQLAINILLLFLGYIPGIIHAIWVITKKLN